MSDEREKAARDEAWVQYYRSSNYQPVVMPAFDYAWSAALKWAALAFTQDKQHESGGVDGTRKPVRSAEMPDMGSVSAMRSAKQTGAPDRASEDPPRLAGEDRGRDTPADETRAIVSESATSQFESGPLSPTKQQPAEQPVAWQYRLHDSVQPWCDCTQEAYERMRAFEHYETRALYAHPPLASAGEQRLLAALIRLRDLDINCTQEEDRTAWAQANAAIAASTMGAKS